MITRTCWAILIGKYNSKLVVRIGSWLYLNWLLAYLGLPEESVNRVGCGKAMVVMGSPFLYSCDFATYSGMSSVTALPIHSWKKVCVYVSINNRDPALTKYFLLIVAYIVDILPVLFWI